MIYHRVHIPRADKKAETRQTKALKVIAGMPIGLGNDADGVAEAFKQTAYKGVGKARVVDIRIARDIHKVKCLYSALLHIIFTYG